MLRLETQERERWRDWAHLYKSGSLVIYTLNGEIHNCFWGHHWCWKPIFIERGAKLVENENLSIFFVFWSWTMEKQSDKGKNKRLKKIYYLGIACVMFVWVDAFSSSFWVVAQKPKKLVSWRRRRVGGWVVIIFFFQQGFKLNGMELGEFSHWV
jgi:hypothetical protein